MIAYVLFLLIPCNYCAGFIFTMSHSVLFLFCVCYKLAFALHATRHVRQNGMNMIMRKRRWH